jgi:hypothetical protein
MYADFMKNIFQCVLTRFYFRFIINYKVKGKQKPIFRRQFMKNRTIKSAIINQLGHNKVIRHYGKTVEINGKKATPVTIRYRRNTADFIGIESSEMTVYAIKNIFGFYKIIHK